MPEAILLYSLGDTNGNSVVKANGFETKHTEGSVDIESLQAKQ